MSLLEAMSLSKPVVAAEVGGVPHVVEHGLNGLTVPAEDPEALGRAVCRLLSDRTFASKIGQAARDTIVEKFNLRDRISKLASIYQEVVG